MQDKHPRTTPPARPNKEKDRAERLAKALIERGATEDQRVIDAIFDQINEPPKKIPEPVFRELFLPYFLGEKTPTTEEDILAHWVGLVGSGSYPADVVDVKGETLFQVPPVYDTSRLNITKLTRGAESFMSIAQNYEHAATQTPIAGNNYMASALSRKLDSTIGDGKPSQYSWDPVLRYYGLDKPASTTASPQSATNGTDVDLSDMQFDE